jgi:general secretion pathway protein I
MPAKARSASDAAGFSLLETIAAFAIAAMTMTALMALLSRNVDGAGGIADYTRAIQLAQSALDDIGIAVPLMPGTTAGRFDSRFRWQLAVAPERSAIVDARTRRAVMPYRVRITVSWPAGSTARSVSLDTVRLGPSS